MNKNIIYAAVAVVVVGLLVWWGVSSRDGSEPSLSPSPSGINFVSPSPTSQPGSNDGSVGGSTFEGTLRASNNSRLGNLMLVQSNQVIYLRTSRDFRSLIGKEVTMTIDGSITNFRLVDIKAK